MNGLAIVVPAVMRWSLWGIPFMEQSEPKAAIAIVVLRGAGKLATLLRGFEKAQCGQLQLTKFPPMSPHIALAKSMLTFSQ